MVLQSILSSTCCRRPTVFALLWRWIMLLWMFIRLLKFCILCQNYFICWGKQYLNDPPTGMEIRRPTHLKVFKIAFPERHILSTSQLPTLIPVPSILNDGLSNVRTSASENQKSRFVSKDSWIGKFYRTHPNLICPNINGETWLADGLSNNREYFLIRKLEMSPHAELTFWNQQQQ